ncbi:hypothetical protein D3C75_1363390 [compost metagenome]
MAKQTILLADHSKIGQISFCKVADLQEMDHCILDTDTPESFLRELGKLDVDYTLV